MKANPGNPNREIYDEFQRVAATNQFIFTQGAISLGAAVIFGPIGMVAYMGAWGVLLMLSFAFARPYRILRALLPQGKWPTQVVPISRSRRLRSIAAAAFLILGLGGSLWFTFGVVFPFLDSKMGARLSDTCVGVICLVLK